MIPLVAGLNLILGVAYTTYGVMTAIEMKRDWRTMGFSHFGAAWIAMAFTCGPHHLVHGIHVGFEGRVPGPLDFIVVLVGLPFGLIWLLLRIEAFVGGRGDRFVVGTPSWLAAAPTLAAVYLTAVIAAMSQVARPQGFHIPMSAYPNVLLVVIYVAIGFFLFRTQLRNRPQIGGWSLSGLSLGVVFPTCAIMHAVYVMYASVLLYGVDSHGLVIDWIGVPAGAYFLWVVRRLYRDALSDWNRATPPIREVVVR